MKLHVLTWPAVGLLLAILLGSTSGAIIFDRFPSNLFHNHYANAFHFNQVPKRDFYLDSPLSAVDDQVDPSLSRLMKKSNLQDLVDPSLSRLMKRMNLDMVDPSLSRLMKKNTANDVIVDPSIIRLMKKSQESV